MIAEGYPSNLLPKEDPPSRWSSGEVLEAARAREGLERSSVLWTYAIFEALARGTLQWRPRGAWQVLSEFGLLRGLSLQDGPRSSLAVGLTWSTESLTKPRFGISLFVRGVVAERAQPETVAEAWLPDAQWFTFPVVVTPVVLEEHQGLMSPPNPRGGLATCWAKDANHQDGVLTAKHVVNGHALGTSVRLTSGPGTLIAKAPGLVDAAFIVHNSALAPSALRNPLAAQQFPAMSTAVDVHTAAGVARNSIAAVNPSFGVFNNPNLHLYVFLRTPQSPGDSGGLVQDVSTKEGVSIYIGSQAVATTSNQPSTGPAGTIGLSQHLLQAQQILGLSLLL